MAAVAYLEFGSSGGAAASTCSKGTFLLNYNFVHSLNTISEYMTIFKKNTFKFFKIYRISLDLTYSSLTFNIFL